LLAISKALKLIGTIENMLPPVLIFQIPKDGFAEARSEVLFRLPAEFVTDFGGVDRGARVEWGLCQLTDLSFHE
jgi:hypothetical protein